MADNTANTGKWYDLLHNAHELHDDLRRDYAGTRAYAIKRPSVRRHMESCEVCLSIGMQRAAAPAPLAGRRRLKLAIRPAQMHQLLKLPANFEIVHMYAENDPNVVCVLVAGDGLPEVAENYPAPASAPDVPDDDPSP